MSIYIEVGWEGLKVCYVFADFPLIVRLLNKRSVVHFCRWKVSHNWSYFVNVIRV